MKNLTLIFLCSVLFLVPAAACQKSGGGAPPEAAALIKDKKYDEGIALLEKAYAADDSNKEVKTELVSAYVAYGNELTFKSDLPPNEKYRKGLKYYRLALKIDPEQKEALENKKLIEDIYASMGRPVPQ